jgi:ATP/ADP translocase
MLVSLACLVIIGIGIYCVVYGIIYYREITKDDREYAKELKEAKKRRKLEAEEKAQKLKESKIEKKKLSEIKTGKP